MTPPVLEAATLDVAGVSTALIDTGLIGTGLIGTGLIGTGLIGTGLIGTGLIDSPGAQEAGAGAPPVLLLHGSGPGVTAAANWRPVIPALSRERRVLAPDQLGFGGTATGEPRTYGRAAWTEHALALLDTLGVGTVAQLIDLLPDARLHVMAGCGHWTMIERTAGFLAVVQPFLAP